MGKYPSTVQTEYSNHVSVRILNFLITEIPHYEREVKEWLGNSDQLPRLPTSLSEKIAADTAEVVRKAILTYFADTGLYPD